MTTAIESGDVVVDLASGSPMQVVGIASQQAGDHPMVAGDAVGLMFGMDEDDVVYDCVFLPTPGDRLSPPTKTYAYPESRILRYPVENALEGDR